MLSARAAHAQPCANHVRSSDGRARADRYGERPPGAGGGLVDRRAGDADRARRERLARSEVELAKQEVTEKVVGLAVGGALIAVAAVLGLVVLGCVAAAAILGLSETMSAWLAAVIVAVVTLLIAIVLALIGKRSIAKAGPPVPDKTLNAAKEDLEWLKQQATSAKT